MDVEAAVDRDVVEHDRDVDRFGELLVVEEHPAFERPLEVRRQHHCGRRPVISGPARAFDRVGGGDRRGLRNHRDATVDDLASERDDAILFVVGKEGELARSGTQHEAVQAGIDQTFDVVAQATLVEMFTGVVERRGHRRTHTVQQRRGHGHSRVSGISRIRRSMKSRNASSTSSGSSGST